MMGEVVEGVADGLAINRYRIGDAFIRSCAALSVAKSAMKVLGVGVRGLYYP